MKVGLAVGKQLLKSLNEALLDISAAGETEIFTLRNNRSLKLPEESFVLHTLIGIDRLMSRGNKLSADNQAFAEADISEVDIILCWETDVVQDNVIPGKEIWTLWLNEQRFDDPLAGLMATLETGNPMTLSIKTQTAYEPQCSTIYFVKMRPARTFSRTRERAAIYFALMIRKCLQGDRKLPSNCKLPASIVCHYSTRHGEDRPACTLWQIIFRNIKNLLLQKKKPQKSYWKLYTEIQGKLPLSNQGLTCVSPPDDRFWADPFPLEYNGKSYLFVEEFVYQDRKGIIAVLEKGVNGEFSRISTALQEPFHLSYPHVFYLDDKLYMIPESGSQMKAQIYECVKFPDQWKKVRDILNGVNATDTTVFFFQNLWWIFTSLTRNKISQDEQLFLYYTEDLLAGNLIPHPENPIALGAECSRMAGSIFTRNGKIYRPAQDCSYIYGGRVVVMEIDKLTKTEYRERKVADIVPAPAQKGLHTYNIGHDYQIVDAY